MFDHNRRNLLFILLLSLGSSKAAWQVTCDFDLPEIAKIIEHLPIECQEIYKSGPELELYQASLKESKKFAESMTKLEESENEDTNGILKPNFEMRFGVYNRTQLHSCALDIGNSTNLPKDSDKMTEYYTCLAKKRDQMLEIMNAKQSKE